MIQLPKRRKSKDNPYTIVLIDDVYYLTFRDSNNILHPLHKRGI